MKLVGFMREVGRELKRVSWPTGKELTRYTIVTLVTITFMAIFFALVDAGLSELIRIVEK